MKSISRISNTPEVLFVSPLSLHLVTMMIPTHSTIAMTRTATKAMTMMMNKGRGVDDGGTIGLLGGTQQS